MDARRQRELLAQAEAHLSRKEFNEAGRKFGMLAQAVIGAKKGADFEEDDYKALLGAGRYFAFAAGQAPEGSPAGAAFLKNSAACYDAISKAFIVQYAETPDRADPYASAVDFAFIVGQYSQRTLYPVFYSGRDAETPNIFIEAARSFARVGNNALSERCWVHGLKWNEAIIGAGGSRQAPEETMPAHARLLEEGAKKTISIQIAEMAVNFLTSVYTDPTGKEGGWVHAIELLAGLAGMAPPQKKDAFMGRAKALCMSGIEQREAELAKSRDDKGYDGQITQLGLAQRLVKLYDWAAKNVTAGYADRRLDNLSLIVKLAKDLNKESVLLEYEAEFRRLREEKGGRQDDRSGIERIVTALLKLPEFMERVEAELAELRKRGGGE